MQPLSLNYCLLVTGSAYGTQQASSAYQFALALLEARHRLSNIFFYREGVLNANRLTAPANDEFDLVRAWSQLAKDNKVQLNVCISAAQRRGVCDKNQTEDHTVAINLQPGFTLSGLGALAEALFTCDRIIQF
ncbi:sulfurtransferase complex subunit TusD [Candidatus Regiella insecticola]|uniref:sulfurtransferase complex subunit TusD n=1 Tax=Candidatus Regiella insecticola TaxID=138073 RepID=UPI0002FBF2EC|nr:sulfurtransferase complex subunit TusD [Candidatus Regiella insecticola]